MPLLASYQLLPQLLHESIIDQAIAPFSCTPEEITHACQQFYQQHQLTSEAEQQAWLGHHNINQQQLEFITTRKLRIEKFKQATWRHKLESYFLKRKGQLDRAIYSLIRTKNRDLAHELYFRLQEGEQTFAELAKQYSQGAEAHSAGIVGPVELGSLHHQLARLLTISQLGQLWSPIPLGEWLVVVRLEKLIPARLDEAMQQRIIQELFEAWLQEQLQQLPESDKIWITAVTHRQMQASFPPAAA